MLAALSPRLNRRDFGTAELEASSDFYEDSTFDGSIAQVDVLAAT